MVTVKEYRQYLRLSIIVYIVLFSVYSILRHYLYFTGAYDLGIFLQSLWTTAHGEGFFFNTPEWEDLGTYSHFGVHNSPILILLVPIYKMFPHAETLLILQTIALGFGALTLFRFAKMLIGEKKAFYVSLMYLANPLIHGINRFDFHPVSLVVPLIFLIPYYYEKRNYLIFILVSLLVLTAKEDSGLVLISLGLFFMIKRYGVSNVLNPKWFLKNIHTLKWEIILISLGILWTLISLFVVIPHYNGGIYPYLTASRVQRYSFSISNIHIDYIIAFFSISLFSVSFIPMFNWEYFLASVPLWLELILPSKTANMVTVGYHYPYMLAPFLFILLVYILPMIQISLKIEYHSKKTKVIPLTMKTFVAVSLISMLLFSPAFHVLKSPYVRGIPMYSLVKVYNKWGPYFWIADNITGILSNSDCPVTTQNLIFPHLANRRETYCLRTLFNVYYLPNNSIVLLAESLPDYHFTVEALMNSTLTANKNYFVLNINDMIIKCYNQTGDDTKKFKECIISSTQGIVQKCKQERNDEK
ncbi:DUF2079 domain-containing protein [Thermococcus sp.]|uniref:DUF2079 domain-containing protein n=1 Tax=Thermococcus sp. TaxID=35749 RepID=UPI0026348E90|nr:DUF2079 domain-containing protein [Thermococcus sp.]